MSDLFRAATSAALPTFFHVGGSVVALGLVVFGAFSVRTLKKTLVPIAIQLCRWVIELFGRSITSERE